MYKRQVPNWAVREQLYGYMADIYKDSADLYPVSYTHLDVYKRQDRGIGIQFVDTQKGKVVWEDYDEFDITYMIEGSYITFNDIAFQLAGAPWVIKSYTKNHITLIQNEASPDKDKIATIELDRVD